MLCCRSESRWGHDDVLQFLQTCLDDIDTELMAEDTCHGQRCKLLLLFCLLMLCPLSIASLMISMILALSASLSVASG